MLNQEAQKQGFKVEYVAESKGVAHALQWEVGVIGMYSYATCVALLTLHSERQTPRAGQWRE